MRLSVGMCTYLSRRRRALYLARCVGPLIEALVLFVRRLRGASEVIAFCRD